MRIALVMGAAIVLFAAKSFAAAGAASFERVGDTAASSMKSGKWAEAYKDLKKLHEWAPDVETVSYDAACSAARLGLLEESFVWLDRAVASGYADAVNAASDADLEPLRGDPRWQPSLERMLANKDELARMTTRRRPEPDPASAPSFATYGMLDHHYDTRWKDLTHDMWKMSTRSRGDASLRLIDNRVAADRRYVAEHPTAGDRDDAAWDGVRSRISLRRPYRLQEHWGDAGLQTLEDIDAFLAAYPDSSHRGEALVQRAYTVFHVRPLEGTTSVRPWRDEDARTLAASLAEASRALRAKAEAGQALARALIVSGVVVDRVTPEMREMYDRLKKSHANQPEVQELLAREGAPVVLRLEGFDEFEGRDLAGRRWSMDSFTGRVTLVDFWATWCAPCREEMPTLKRIWRELRPRGLQFVGVSLDAIPRKDFEFWLRQNEIEWPQILTGRGFDTSLAREFRVRSIPYAVLIGPDGKVAAADLRGDDLYEAARHFLETVPDPVSSP